jgi:DNA (cytosine-5)-methyltransferase 1
MQAAGYTVQVFCLNAASMGVPQKRERVFFIGHKKEFLLPKLRLEFNEEAILFGDVEDSSLSKFGQPLSEAYKKWWLLTPQGENLDFAHPKKSFFNTAKVSRLAVSKTIASTLAGAITHHSMPNKISDEQICLIGTYPIDYNFKALEPQYLIGMSVPPVMTAQISHQIYLQWLSKIK